VDCKFSCALVSSVWFGIAESSTVRDTAALATLFEVIRVLTPQITAIGKDIVIWPHLVLYPSVYLLLLLL
jgi:hypothetical protein